MRVTSDDYDRMSVGILALQGVTKSRINNGTSSVRGEAMAVEREGTVFMKHYPSRSATAP